MQGDPQAKDKDYSFARLCDLKAPVTIRMSVLSPLVSRVRRRRLTSRTSLEGRIPKRSYTDILADPSLKHAGAQNE
jgi:phosphatidylinositol 3-kinase